MTHSTVASSAASVSRDRVASAARNGSTVTSSSWPNAARSAGPAAPGAGRGGRGRDAAAGAGRRTAAAPPTPRPGRAAPACPGRRWRRGPRAARTSRRRAPRARAAFRRGRRGRHRAAWPGEPARRPARAARRRRYAPGRARAAVVGTPPEPGHSDGAIPGRRAHAQRVPPTRSTAPPPGRETRHDAHRTHEHSPRTARRDGARRGHPEVLGRPRPRPHRADPGRPGHLRRQHRAPVIGESLRLGSSDMQWLVTAYLLLSGGGLLLGRPHRRPAAPAPGLPHRHDDLHRRLPVQRLREQRRRAHHRPRRPRARRSPDDPSRAVAGDDHLLRCAAHQVASPSGVRSAASASPPACCSAAR